MAPINPFTITYDDEDLTEIESSDDEDPPPPPSPISIAPARAKSTRPSTQTATEKSRARGGLQSVAPALKPYRSTTYSTASLNEWISAGLLDLDAEYQRGIVWNEQKQIGLIDSIFRNYYIPPIVFTVIQTDDGNEKRVCIDGKQRLTSIRRFILGEIPYKDVTTNRKTWYTSAAGARRKLISPAMQNTFKNKQITCSEYDSVTQEQEREIFQRVQMGMTLVPADRLPAINGPYADLVRGLRRRIESTDGFGAYHNWGEARGRDFQALTQIVYLMSHGTEPKKSEPTAMRLEAFLSQAGVDVSALEQNAQQVLDIFIRIAQHPTLSKPLQGELAPLEFVMAFYLIFTYRGTLVDPQLSAAIHHMRQKFREVAPNRKVNTTVFKSILNFVLVHVRKLKLNIPVDLPVYETKVDPSKSSISRVNKRKNAEREQDDSDADYIIPLKKKATPAPKSESKTPAPVASGSQTSKAPPSRLKLESRMALKNSAKTTIRKTSTAKKTNSAPVRKPSVASSISSSASAHIPLAKVVKPSYPSSLPSSRKNSLGSEEFGAQSVSTAGVTASSSSTAPAMNPNVPSGPSSASAPVRRFPLPGRSPSVPSPFIPNFSPQFTSGQQTNMINAGNAAETILSSAQNRLGAAPTPTRDPRLRSASSLSVTIPSSVDPLDMGESSFSSVTPTASATTATSAVSGTSTPVVRPKLPNFTRINVVNPNDFGAGSRAPVSAPAPAIAGMNSRPPVTGPFQTGLQQQQQQPQPQPQQQQQQQHTTPVPPNKSLTHLLGVVQPPTRDPRIRPPALRQDQDQGTARLPTPAASPQILDRQLSMLSLSSSDQFPSGGGARRAPATPDLGLAQQPPLKRMHPSPPYPGSGNQS